MLAVRVRRIELPTTAWKAVVLPVNYTRFIPSCSSIANIGNNINQLSHFKINAGGGHWRVPRHVILR